MTRAAVILAGLLAVIAAAQAPPPTLREKSLLASQEFVLEWHVWENIRGEHRNGVTDAREPRAWEHVKQSFEKLDRSLKNERAGQ